MSLHPRVFLFLFLLAPAYFCRPALANSVTVEWAPVRGAARYEVRIEAGDGTVHSVSVPGTIRSWSGDLPPGKYRYSVRGIALNGTPGDWTRPEAFSIASSPGQVLSMGFGLDLDYRYYREDGVAPVTLLSLDPAVSGTLFLGRRWTAGFRGSVTGLCLNNSRSDVLARFLDTELYASYSVSVSRWVLGVSAGLAFRTMLVGNNAFGYGRENELLFLPSVSYEWDERNAVELRLRADPVVSGSFFSPAERNLGSEIGYRHRLEGGSGWMASLAYEDLRFTTGGVAVDSSLLSLDLTVGW